MANLNSADVPTAGELPATRAMLAEVRTELLERIDQAKIELRTEIQAVRVELKSEINGLKADVHGLKADVARIGFLVEEQNARNKIVLDALMAVIDRQGRTEQRVDKIEETLRALAASRSSG